jgi:hypothetical protein
MRFVRCSFLALAAAILYDRLDVSQLLNVKVISLDQAVQAYKVRPACKSGGAQLRQHTRMRGVLTCLLLLRLRYALWLLPLLGFRLRRTGQVHHRSAWHDQSVTLF